MNNAEAYEQAVKFRRHFHRYPEVSTQEYQTQAYIAEVLEQNRIAYKTYETGIKSLSFSRKDLDAYVFLTHFRSSHFHDPGFAFPALCPRVTN